MGPRMTFRRVVLYATTTTALAYIAACGLILHAANRYDRILGPRP